MGEGAIIVAGDLFRRDGIGIPSVYKDVGELTFLQPVLQFMDELGEILPLPFVIDFRLPFLS